MSEKPKKFVFLASMFGLGLVALAPHANAAVMTGDTYDISVIGYNAAGYAYLVSPIDATFGQTTVYAGGEFNGANVTVSSSETVGATRTTDTYTISVPSNFSPTGTTIAGAAVMGLEVDIGENPPAGPDEINFSQPVNPATLTFSGSMIYSGGTFALTPYSSLDATDTMLAVGEGVSVSTGSISADKVKSFTISFSYANPVAVPEPGSSALVYGICGCGLLFLVRRRR